MRTIVHTMILLGFCTNCSVQPATGPYDAQAARSNIVAALPAGWSVMSPPWQQDRFTKAYFTHPRTEAFLLVGPASNCIDWTDRSGGSHREHLFRECLYI